MFFYKTQLWRKTMQILTKVSFVLGGYVFLNVAVWSADETPIEGPGLGIERIARYPISYSFSLQTAVQTTGQHSSQPMSLTAYNFGVYNTNESRGRFFSVAPNEYPAQTDFPFGASGTARTLTNDIRQSQIDKEQFDTYIDEEDYVAAWRMTLSNYGEQGNLWKRRVKARTNAHIVKLIEQGIFRGKASLLARRDEIVHSFRDYYEVHDELRRLSQTTEEAIRKEYLDFMANPQVSFLLPDTLRKEIPHRFFGEH
jgi:hypothetical protein